MGGVGKSPNQRRRVSVKRSSSENVEAADADAPSPQQVAAYIAEMCGEMAIMAKGVNLPLVAHLLAMAQAEAEYAADQVI
jgi:mannose/fructose-specific phosphotransferase system component IIA